MIITTTCSRKISPAVLTIKKSGAIRTDQIVHVYVCVCILDPRERSYGAARYTAGAHHRRAHPHVGHKREIYYCGARRPTSATLASLGPAILAQFQNCSKGLPRFPSTRTLFSLPLSFLEKITRQLLFIHVLSFPKENLCACVNVNSLLFHDHLKAEREKESISLNTRVKLLIEYILINLINSTLHSTW